MTKPLAALLTSRELARVAREHFARYGRDTTRTNQQYSTELRAVAAQLYPGKVSA